MVLKSKHMCGFNTFLRPHQREFGIESEVVHPSLTFWLDPCIDERLANWHPHISIEHNRREDWKELNMIKYPITKNSAKEKPKLLLKYA